jgi:hypothetical protein
VQFVDAQFVVAGQNHYKLSASFDICVGVLEPIASSERLQHRFDYFKPRLWESERHGDFQLPELCAWILNDAVAVGAEATTTPGVMSSISGCKRLGRMHPDRSDAAAESVWLLAF